MLQFFRINDPYRLIIVFLILVAVRVIWMVTGIPLTIPELKFLVIGERLGDGFTIYKELYDYTGPLSALVYKYLDLVFGRARWVHIALSTLLVIIQAGLFNNILLRNKAYDENTYVPAFIYVILSCGTMDFFTLSPQLMSLTFVLLALNHVFRRIDNVITDELFLYSGIYLGVATFFYLPAIIYMVLFLLSLILFSTAVARRLLIFLYGTFVVFLAVWGYFFWFDAAGDFILSFFITGVLKPSFNLVSYTELFYASLALIVVALLSFSVIFTQRLTTFQQKMQQVMIMLFIGSIVILLLAKDLSTNELVLFIPTLTFFLTYYLLGLRRRVLKFLMPYIIVGSLIAYPFYWATTNQGLDLFVDNQSTELTNEKLMGLGVPVDYYANNKLSGPFFDDFASRKELQKIDYLDGADELFDVINRSSPTIIIDRWGAMDDIFSRFPDLKKKYQQTETGVYKRINTSN